MAPEKAEARETERAGTASRVGWRGLEEKVIRDCCRAAAMARFQSLLIFVSLGLCPIEVDTKREGSRYDLTVGMPDGVEFWIGRQRRMGLS